MHRTNYLSKADTGHKRGAKTKDQQNELISVTGADKVYMQTKGMSGMQGEQVNY